MIKKIERQYFEMNEEEGEVLFVEDLPLKQYLSDFFWNGAKYSTKRPLPDLVATIKGSMGKVEEELGRLTSSFSEKTQALSGLRRKNNTFNPALTPLSPYLSPEALEDYSPFTSSSSEFLKTVIAVVPEKYVERWEREVEEVGGDIAAFGGPDWQGRREDIGRLVLSHLSNNPHLFLSFTPLVLGMMGILAPS